jgi:ribose-phosphate pyrophosphokinase
MFRITMDIVGKRSRDITYESFIFKGGEVQVKLAPFDVPSRMEMVSFNIRADITNANQIMELLLITDALRRSPAGSNTPIDLTMPYLPYARQDRAMQSGESLALKVFCNMINAQKYRTVFVWDVHSDVSLALLDNAESQGADYFVNLIDIKYTQNLVLVAPDAGSLKKVFKCAQLLGVDMIRADKTRSVVDGSITGTVVYTDDLNGQDVLIVDDICDGGRTFIELGKALKAKGAGNVYLYVTHGILSNGLNCFHGAIDKIFSPNFWPEWKQGIGDFLNPIV